MFLDCSFLGGLTNMKILSLRSIQASRHLSIQILSFC
jgi:hypothetical protein